MKTKRLICTIFLGMVLFSGFAQERPKMGITGTLQDNQLGIMMPFWVGEKLVLAPAFDFKFAKSIGSEISLGLIPRFYFKNEKLCPYFGLKAGVMLYRVFDSNQNTLDLLGGLAYGVEYFFDNNFSVGVELQGNVSKSDKNSIRFGNPGGINFNTATMVMATIYF